MNIREALCADDVLLVPKYSEIISRSQVDLSVDLGKGIKLKCPIVSANMSNISGPQMAKAISDLGGLALLHRFMEYEEIMKTFVSLVENEPWRKDFIGCSIGVQEKDKELAKNLVSAGCKIICIDIAHAHSKMGLEMTKYIHETYPDVLLIVGNVATYSGYKVLSDNGADVVKCGIGSGSICSTRIETGNGVPQLTALSDIYEQAIHKENIINDLHILNCYESGGPSYLLIKDRITRLQNEAENRAKIIADGGIRRAGDACKYLCFSDAVMLGNVLAGTDEAPGDTFVIDGVTHKTYAGSSTHKSNHIEGVVGLVPSKGPVKKVVESFLEGIRSGCSYQGVSNLEDLKKNPEFVRISSAGLIESHPHSVKIVK